MYQKYLHYKNEYFKLKAGCVQIVEYKTDYEHDGPIHALSDIHGDLHSFIITLRDCAKVIGKADYMLGNNQDVVDPNIEINLNIDISEDDNDYDETLGYEWIGGNSYIVICGDMIDPSRSNCYTHIKNKNCIKHDGLECVNYPQIEIKVLRFINAMNKKAQEHGGRIFKLLGNHEIESITPDNGAWIEGYTFERDHDANNDKNLNKYYRGDYRSETFNVGNQGFKLLFEDGCGLLIKINNSIFVHGELPDDDIDEIIDVNHFMNDRRNHENISQQWYRYIKKYGQKSIKTSPLWRREWACPYNINSRIRKGIQENFCKQKIISKLKTFMMTTDMTIINNLRVVLGHCVQSDITINNDNLIGTTFTNLYSQSHVSDTYNGETIYIGDAKPEEKEKIFGITMQCQKPNLKDFFIYHVDIGSSRGFDEPYSSIRLDLPNTNFENKYLYSKTPQILTIKYDEEENEELVYITKSKMRNTRIHLPRPNYETYIANNDTYNINNINNYNKKYLK